MDIHVSVGVNTRVGDTDEFGIGSGFCLGILSYTHLRRSTFSSVPLLHLSIDTYFRLMP